MGCSALPILQAGHRRCPPSQRCSTGGAQRPSARCRRVRGAYSTPLLGAVQRLAKIARLLTLATRAAPTTTTVPDPPRRVRPRHSAAAPVRAAVRRYPYPSPNLRDSNQAFEPRARLRPEREVRPLAALLTLEQPGIGQLLQMVTCCWLRQPQRRLELARTHRPLTRRQQVDDLHPRRIRQDPKQRRRRLRLLIRKRRRPQRPATLDQPQRLQGGGSHRRASIYRLASIRQANAAGPRCVVTTGNKGWSLYGAPWFQPVAIGGKSRSLRHCRNKRKPLPCVATACRSERMVKRGSTVRVRQRASTNRLQSGRFVCLGCK